MFISDTGHDRRWTRASRVSGAPSTSNRACDQHHYRECWHKDYCEHAIAVHKKCDTDDNDHADKELGVVTYEEVPPEYSERPGSNSIERSREHLCDRLNIRYGKTSSHELDCEKGNKPENTNQNENEDV